MSHLMKKKKNKSILLIRKLRYRLTLYHLESFFFFFCIIKKKNKKNKNSLGRCFCSGEAGTNQYQRQPPSLQTDSNINLRYEAQKQQKGHDSVSTVENDKQAECSKNKSFALFRQNQIQDLKKVEESSNFVQKKKKKKSKLNQHKGKDKQHLKRTQFRDDQNRIRSCG